MTSYQITKSPVTGLSRGALPLLSATLAACSDFADDVALYWPRCTTPRHCHSSRRRCMLLLLLLLYWYCIYAFLANCRKGACGYVQCWSWVSIPTGQKLKCSPSAIFSHGRQTRRFRAEPLKSSRNSNTWGC